MKSKTQSTFALRKIFRTFSLAMLFVLSTHALRAQMQYNQWAFGWHASHDFITNAPLTTPPLIANLQESAVWCDASGNLMFYTDGRNIYNAVNPLLSCISPSPPYCLNGNPNGGGGTQGVLIVPKVGGPADEFFIFTVSDKDIGGGNRNFGLSYYVYNTSTGALSGPTRMGVAPGTTGSYTSEGLTAIPHNNGVDYWIIVKPMVTAVPWINAMLTPPPPNQPAGATNTSIYAYLVTAAGVSPDPVVSESNYSINIAPGPNQATNVVNEIKCSPDRQYVSITNRTSSTGGHTRLYRFNASSGQFIFLQTLPMAGGYAPWGASFSPNSLVLYVCGYYNNLPPGPPGGGEVLRQYDLATLHCDPFTAVPFCDYYSMSYTAPGTFATQLQLTRDGRIFRTRRISQNIDVIATPNNIGCTNIGYTPNVIDVSTVPANTCRQGLPNNIDAQAGPVLTSEWPKTTTNTVTSDNGVSMDVDADGDVYSAGAFKQSTQFETVTITGGGTASMYLTKYHQCEGLEWVATGIPTTPTGFVTCHSMDFGNFIDRVMVTGRFRGTSVFSSGVHPGPSLPCPAPITINGGGIYIATYNSNGCLLGVTTIPDDANFIHNSAHINIGRSTNPTTGVTQNRVYLAVNETPLLNDHSIRIYAYVLTGPATLTNAWIIPLRGSPSEQASDIHSDGRRIAVTGTYERDIFWNTDPVAFASTPTGIFEAFVATMIEGFTGATNVITQTRGFEPTALGTSRSSGIGVQCMGNAVFMTGTYTGTTSSVFGTGNAMAGNGGISCAYAVRLNTGAGGSWGHTFSSDGIAFGHDVTQAGNFVYFTGTWTNDSLFNIDNTVMPTVVPMKNHIYVVRMHLNGNFTSPACFQNHSYMADDATQIMKPARMAVYVDNPGWIYVNGSYMGTGQMENDIAFNSPLSSTPGALNSFVWRYRNGGGISFRESEGDIEPESTMEPVEEPKLFPNPTNSTLNIQLPARDESTVIEIYSASGQLMMEMKTANTMEQVDVSSWAAGIYFIRMTYGEEVSTEKFMRE